MVEVEKKRVGKRWLFRVKNQGVASEWVSRAELGDVIYKKYRCKESARLNKLRRERKRRESAAEAAASPPPTATPSVPVLLPTIATAAASVPVPIPTTTTATTTAGSSARLDDQPGHQCSACLTGCASEQQFHMVLVQVPCYHLSRHTCAKTLEQCCCGCGQRLFGHSCSK